MKDIKDLKENECIHIRNKKEAKGITKLLNKEGLKWCNGKKYKSLEEFTHHIESGCFFLLPKTGEWSHHNNNRECYPKL